MKALVNLGGKKSFRFKSSKKCQLEAVAELMKKHRFYGLLPVFSFKQ